MSGDRSEAGPEDQEKARKILSEIDRECERLSDTSYQPNAVFAKHIALALRDVRREERVATRSECEVLAHNMAAEWKRNANATAAAGEGDLGSIEAATCLDAQAAGALMVAQAIREGGSPR